MVELAATQDGAVPGAATDEHTTVPQQEGRRRGSRMKHRGGVSPSVAPPVVDLCDRSTCRLDAPPATRTRPSRSSAPLGESRPVAIAEAGLQGPFRIEKAGGAEGLSRVVDTRGEQDMPIAHGGKNGMGEYVRASHPRPRAGSRVVDFCLAAIPTGNQNSPSGRASALCCACGESVGGPARHAGLRGSKMRTLRETAPWTIPPTTSTRPSGRSVAECENRTSGSGTVEAHRLRAGS